MFCGVSAFTRLPVAGTNVYRPNVKPFGRINFILVSGTILIPILAGTLRPVEIGFDGYEPSTLGEFRVSFKIADLLDTLPIGLLHECAERYER